MLLLDFFENVYSPLRLRGRSERTSILYRLSIKSFCETLQKAATLDDLSDINISIHMARIRRKGRSAGTANKDRAQILAIWRFANRRGYVKSWPDIPEDIEPKRTPKAWLPEEVDKMLKHFSQLSGYVGSNKESNFWCAMIHVCLDSGERIGAVRELKWSDINGNWLSVRAETRKGKRTDREYWLVDETVDALKKLDRRTEQVFHWPYCFSYLWIRYGNLLKAAGLPHDRKSKFHRFRRTHASILYACGADPQRAMGHSDWRTTEGYIDPRFSPEIRPAEILAKFLSGERRREPQQESQRKSG